MSRSQIKADRECLLQLIQTVYNAGSKAAVNVWISPASKGEHIYYKLSSKNLAIENLYLGKAESEKYRTRKARIKRREVIAELEQRLSMLQALIDRQFHANT